MSYWVYIHTCPNGKKYVGCTTQARPELRWGRNGEGYKSQLFGRAISKHGWSSITHEVFEVESEEEMYRKEVELISFYHSNDPKYGYNNSVGGEKGASGCKHSEEFRKHRSETQKKKWLDPEYRKHRSETQKEKWSDPEYRRKQTEAHRGKTLSEETKRKHSEDSLKRWSDPEYRKKMSEIQKKVHSDPEVQRKRSEALKGKPFNEEHRKRIAESNRRKAKDPEFRKKLSEACKNKPRIKIRLQDGTLVETTKSIIVRDYVNKGKEFEYVS